jgi:low temperature requirement protein LtrA
MFVMLGLAFDEIFKTVFLPFAVSYLFEKLTSKVSKLKNFSV